MKIYDLTQTNQFFGRTERKVENIPLRSLEEFQRHIAKAELVPYLKD